VTVLSQRRSLYHPLLKLFQKKVMLPLPWRESKAAVLAEALVQERLDPLVSSALFNVQSSSKKKGGRGKGELEMTREGSREGGNDEDSL
jgi:hypothetical protein